MGPDRIKTQYSKKIMSQYQFVHHKTHMNSAGFFPNTTQYSDGALP